VSRRCLNLEAASTETARKRKAPGQGRLSEYDLQLATLKKTLSKLVRAYMDATPDGKVKLTDYYDNALGSHYTLPRPSPHAHTHTHTHTHIHPYTHTHTHTHTHFSPSHLHIHVHSRVVYRYHRQLQV
jgi:hypothetical protein